MLTKKDIEEFHVYIDRLNLRFPVAALAKATGFSKGNVSEYLNKKKDPSEAFMKKVYEVFPKKAKEPDKGSSAEEPEAVYSIKESSTDKLVDTIAVLIRQNDKLADTNKILAEKLSTIPVGVREETQRSVDAMLIGLREFVLKVSTGARYKNLEEAQIAFRKGLGAVVEKTRVKDTQNH